MINNRLIHKKYDCHFSGKQRLRYLICSTPRSGSTMLTRILTQTELAGCPEEYLRHDRIGQWTKRFKTNKLNFLSYIEEIEKHRTSSNGIFGLKLHYRDYSRLFSSLSKQKVGERWLASHHTIFFVRRRNKLEQAISLYKAVKSKTWSIDASIKETKQTAKASLFEPEKISFLIKQILEEEENWIKLLTHLKMDYHEIWYETLTKNTDLTTRQALKLIGIDHSQLATINIMTKRQSDKDSLSLKRQFIAHYKHKSNLRT